MKSLLTYLLLLLVATTACESMRQPDKDDTLLARVHDDYLYASDLKGVIPENASPHDSIVLLRNYVSNWVKTHLMVDQAKQNLTPSQLDFEKQLEDYRNSLIIFTYERELIRQMLDTVVSDEEIEEYYKTHKGDFELKENIAKVIYAVVEDGLPEVKTFEKIFRLPDSLLLDSLESFGKEYALSYYLDTATWITFSSLRKQVPLEDYYVEKFKRRRRLVKFTDNGNVYMIKFVDFRIKDDVSPLAFEYEGIRNIIVNKRKMQLIKKVRSDIYNKALEHDEFEIYYQE